MYVHIKSHMYLFEICMCWYIRLKAHIWKRSSIPHCVFLFCSMCLVLHPSNSLPDIIYIGLMIHFCHVLHISCRWNLLFPCLYSLYMDCISPMKYISLPLSLSMFGWNPSAWCLFGELFSVDIFLYINQSVRYVRAQDLLLILIHLIIAIIITHLNLVRKRTVSS